MLSLAVGYSYYNDLKSIQRSIPSFIDYVDFVFAVDGKYEFREGSEYSTDGSTEYLKQFPNIIHSQFVGMEHDKRNMYLELAQEMDVDVLLIIDSDEYVWKADWKLFKNNLEEMIGNNKNQYFFGLEYIVDASGGSCCYPRIWNRPGEIRYYKAHCLFMTPTGIYKSSSATAEKYLVKGITLKMDDSLRSEEYLKQTSQYQQKMIDYEKPIRRLFR